MKDKINKYIRSSNDSTARFCIIAVLLIGSLGFLGWVFDIPVFKNINADLTHMRLITSIMLMISSIALWQYYLNSTRKMNRMILLVTGLVISIVSAVTIYVFFVLVKTGHESFLAKANFLNLFLSHESRMALITAVTFLIFGIIMILFSGGKHRNYNVAHVLVLPAGVLSYFVLVCYILGVYKFFEVDNVFTALNTGIAFCGLSIAVLYVHPETWLMKVWSGTTTGSIMARRLLPGLAILPILIGWLRIYGEQSGYYKSEVGVALVAITYMLSFLLLVWFSARSVNTIEESRQKSEEEKKLAERQLAITLESIGDAVISTDNDGKVVYMNTVAEMLTGWKLREAKDKPSGTIFNIINEHTRAEVESPITKVLETRAIVALSNHTILIKKDGTEVPIDDSGAPIIDTNGNLTGVVLVFRDISERKRVETNLRKSEERLRRSQEIGHLGGWELDLIHNELFWSDEIYRIFGLQPQEFGATYEAFLEAVHPEDRDKVNQAYSSSLEQGRDEYEIEHRVVRKDNGEIRFVHEKCSHIRDNSGSIIKSIGMVHDITRRKLSEIALKESEERVRLKLDSILSPEGNIEDLELDDILNTDEIQLMMDHFYKMTAVPMAIIDTKGKVLVGVGWQDICTKFHRVHPDTCANCIESDSQLTLGIPDGEFKLYKCANGMWDIATPINIGGHHKGNLFMGQFFFDDETIDYERFRLIAKRYGFNEDEYISTLNRTCRMSRSKLENAKGFFLTLANKISQLSFSNIKLARSIGERERISEDLIKNNQRLEIISETAGRLLSAANPQEIVNELCTRVMQFLHCDVFFNFIVDEEAQKLHLNAFAGIAERTAESIEWLDYGVAVCGCVARDRVRIIAENIPVTPDPRTDLIRSFGVKAYCCHPLMVQGKVLGTLSFGTRRRNTFMEEEIAMMKIVVDHVAIAINRIKNQEALLESEKRARHRAEELEKIMNIVPSAIWIAQDPLCREIIGNATANVFYEAAEGENVSAKPGPGEPIPPRRFFHNGKELDAEELPMQVAVRTGEDVRNSEIDVLLPSGRRMSMLGNAIPLKDENGKVRGCLGAFMDISERKKAEKEQLLTVELLRIVNESNTLAEFIHSSTNFFQQKTGCEAIGIRLKDDEDYPYFETKGFSEEFVLSEKSLCTMDKNGNVLRDIKDNPVLECMCGNVLCGRVNSSKSYFTEFGSFWSNFTSKTFNNTPEENRQKHIRNRCNSEGYESVALIPLKLGDERIGLLQVNDKRRDAFTAEMINLLERLSGHFTIALARFIAEESENKTMTLLTESEEKYRSLFNGMIEGFAYHEIILDGNGKPCDYRFLSMNPAFESHTGLKAMEVLGKKASEVLPSLERYWVEIYGDVAMNQKTIEYENYSSNLDRYFRVSAFSNKKGYFATIFEDITKRVRAEQELSSTKNYLESLINYANAPIIVWNPKLEIQLFNGAFEHLTGFKSSEVIGKKLDIFFPQSSLKEINSRISEALYENWESIEIPIMTKNQEIKTVLWNSANIYESDGKTLISVIAQGNDITERKRTEQRLNEAQEKLNLALDNGNIGIWERDLLTNRLVWDKRMEKMMGFKEGTFDGNHQTFEKCLVEEDVLQNREAIRKAIEADIPYETIYRIRTREGSINYINSKAQTIKDEKGKPLKLSGVCFDVTDMKKGAERILIKLNDDLHRSNKELEQFAYVASHDLQEPLRMVSSFTQLLAQRYKDKLDEDGKEFIKYAVDGATRMQRLINDLLNYSRIGTRGQNITGVNLNEVLGKVINNLSVSIEEKGAVITHDELPSIVGDEVQMMQLMQNLVGNALKFCDKTPVIHISAEENQTHYHFSVKDNGIGIEEQYYNKIFLIFQRLVPKDKYGGTGMGLAICKRIVERHGGNIWIDSKPGNGTTFYFTILKSMPAL